MSSNNPFVWEGAERVGTSRFLDDDYDGCPEIFMSSEREDGRLGTELLDDKNDVVSSARAILRRWRIENDTLSQEEGKILLNSDPLSLSPSGSADINADVNWRSVSMSEDSAMSEHSDEPIAPSRWQQLMSGEVSLVNKLVGEELTSSSRRLPQASHGNAKEVNKGFINQDTGKPRGKCASSKCRSELKEGTKPQHAHLVRTRNALQERHGKGNGPSVVELELELDEQLGQIEGKLANGKLGWTSTKPGFRPGGGTGAMPRQRSPVPVPHLMQNLSPERLVVAEPSPTGSSMTNWKSRSEDRRGGTSLPLLQKGQSASGLHFKRLHGTSVRVYFCGGAPTSTKEAQEVTECKDREAEIEETALVLEERQAKRRLLAAWKGWHELLTDAKAEVSAASKWLDWRRHLRCWRAWRHVVLQEASERAQQALLAARKKEEIAGRFYRLVVIQKTIRAWWESAERSKEENMQAQLEQEQRLAYEEDMERIRQTFFAKHQVACRFCDMYTVHRAITAWQRGVRAYKQEALAVNQRRAAQIKIEAAIAAKMKKAAAKAITATDIGQAPTERSRPDELKGPSRLPIMSKEPQETDLAKALDFEDENNRSSRAETMHHVEESAICPAADLIKDEEIRHTGISCLEPASVGDRLLEAPSLNAEKLFEGVGGQGGNKNEVVPESFYECPLPGEEISQASHGKKVEHLKLETSSDAVAAARTADKANKGNSGKDYTKSGMEMRAKERAKRRAELQARYAAQRAAEEKRLKDVSEAERKRAEEAVDAQRKLAAARRREVEKQAEKRRAVLRLREQEIMLAGLHYNLSILRRQGWKPWIRLMDEKRAELWHAAQWSRRRLLRAALRQWWAPVEISLAQDWEMHQTASNFNETRLAVAAIQGFRQWCLIVSWRKAALLRSGMASFALAVKIRRAEDKLSGFFRMEHLCRMHFRAWRSFWQAFADKRLLAETQREAEAWDYACRVLQLQSLRAWRAAVNLGHHERKKAERKAVLWSQVHSWLSEGEQKEATSAPMAHLASNCSQRTSNFSTKSTHSPLPSEVLPEYTIVVDTRKAVFAADNTLTGTDEAGNQGYSRENGDLVSYLPPLSALLRRQEQKKSNCPEPRFSRKSSLANTSEGSDPVHDDARILSLQNVKGVSDSKDTKSDISTRLKGFLAVLPPAPVVLPRP